MNSLNFWKLRLCVLAATTNFALCALQEVANAQFMGTLEFKPAGCEHQGQCILTYDLRFRDPNGVEWLAKASDTTDGATIPVWAQSVIGQPFDASYIKAAVIHDHYCTRHVRPWRATHRAFYDALRELQVPDAKAKIMYYAVYLAGPKWVTLIPGEPCGPNCIFNLPTGSPGNVGDVKPNVLYRPADYLQKSFQEELATVASISGQLPMR